MNVKAWFPYDYQNMTSYDFIVGSIGYAGWMHNANVNSSGSGSCSLSYNASTGVLTITQTQCNFGSDGLNASGGNKFVIVWLGTVGSTGYDSYIIG